MLKKIMLIAGLFVSIISAAQKIQYRSYSYGAFLTGQTNGFQATTTHGLETGTWFFGIGTGYDTYRKESVPLFATASKYLWASAKDFFITLNGGTSFALKNEIDPIGTATASSFMPKLFGEAGLGYRLPLKTLKVRQGLVFGAYYSYKGITQKNTIPGDCSNPPCADKYEYIDYKLNRWAFKLGFAL